MVRCAWPSSIIIYMFFVFFADILDTKVSKSLIQKERWKQKVFIYFIFSLWLFYVRKEMVNER